jgi:hypothetical protein
VVSKVLSRTRQIDESPTAHMRVRRLSWIRQWGMRMKRPLSDAQPYSVTPIVVVREVVIAKLARHLGGCDKEKSVRCDWLSRQLPQLTECVLYCNATGRKAQGDLGVVRSDNRSSGWPGCCVCCLTAARYPAATCGADVSGIRILHLQGPGKFYHTTTPWHMSLPGRSLHTTK